MRKPYPTDLSDVEWNYIEPHMPIPKEHGRPRIYGMDSEQWLHEGVRVDREKLLPPKGFVVLPRRWIVERSFAWINKGKRELMCLPDPFGHALARLPSSAQI